MLRKEEILLILYFIVVILFLAFFGILFIVTYLKRKNKLVQERLEAEQRFREELNNARLEIQEATLKNVSWELHDNIGQLLSVASIQTNILSKKIDDVNKQALVEVKNLVGNSLTEVRALSRSLNNEVIDQAGLQASVQNELDRFNRLEVLDAEFEIKGEPYDIPAERSIILFRILQEYFSNVIKYAGASKMKVTFNYSPDFLEIMAHEDGRGFEPDNAQTGSGLINMRSRAAMLNTDFNLNSSIGQGTSLSLRYPTKTN